MLQGAFNRSLGALSGLVSLGVAPALVGPADAALAVLAECAGLVAGALALPVVLRTTGRQEARARRLGVRA